MTTRRSRRVNFGGSAAGRALLLVLGIVIAQVAAVAVNSATSSAETWPWGLDHVQRHPFAWSGALTTALALLAVATSWSEARQSGRNADRTAAETLLLQLLNIHQRLAGIRRMVAVCGVALDRISETTSQQPVINALAAVRNVPDEIDQSRRSLPPLIDGAVLRVRQRGGRRYDATALARGAPAPTIDAHAFDTVKVSADQAPGLAVAVCAWIEFWVNQLGELVYELQVLELDLQAAQNLLTQLSTAEPLEKQAFMQMESRIRSWREVLGGARSTLAAWAAAIGVPIELL